MQENLKKKCFVIMPISDQDGYEKGHFTRVYNYIIIPACEKAGFEPIRADDENKTNFIILDILRKIIDADIVLCDLSGKNPNVLYELGIRQAFNKNAVLIKDIKTGRIFDIQGLRTVDYDENLRIDEVEKCIDKISKTIIETDSSNDDVNSLIQMLSIQPAELPGKIEISQESSLIIDALKDISNRLYSLENNRIKSFLHPKEFVINNDIVELGEAMFDKDLVNIGTLLDVQDDAIYVRKDGKISKIMKDSKYFSDITNLPF